MESCLKRPFTPNVMKHHFIDIMFNTKSDVPSMLACNVKRMLT